MSRKKGNATMTPAQYRRIVGKLRAAYAALSEAMETAEYFDGQTIAQARFQLSLVPDVLRVQVCTRCWSNGHYDVPEKGCARSCAHEEVPAMKINERIGVSA